MYIINIFNKLVDLCPSVSYSLAPLFFITQMPNRGLEDMVQSRKWKMSWIKFSAAVVCFVFSTTTVAWSAPQVPSIQNFNPNIQPATSAIDRLEIPAHVGFIRDRYVPAEYTRLAGEVRFESSPAVVHIEDAHS